MAAAALIVSIVALVASVLAALAVMELIANGRQAGGGAPEQDLIEDFELLPEVVGTRASSHGLPAEIDSTDRHLVLVVSPMCARCGLIMGSLHGTMPEGLTVVVTASAPARMREWTEEHGLAEGDLVFDDDMSIAKSLGVDSSPTALGFAAGEICFAAGVGGPAALEDLLAQRTQEVTDEDLERVRRHSSASENESAP